MRYYLGFVLFGLLMGAVCVLFEVHRAAPSIAPVRLFGACAQVCNRSTDGAASRMADDASGPPSALPA